RDPVAEDDPDWVGRLWRGADYWSMVGGHMNASPLPKPLTIKLPELPSKIRCAYEFDAQTLQMRDADLRRTPDGIFVTVKSAFGAVLLPTGDCPPLVLLDADPPRLNADGRAEFTLRSFSAWGNRPAPRVRVEAPGLQVTPRELTLPGTVTVGASSDTWPGMYPLKVSGECLPLKRWFRAQQ
ncbi:hypothetical protein LCGC14_3004360, partial [marine sediment metagenome]